MDIYKFTVHICGCGYRTGDYGNANRHKKVVCGHEMIKKEMRFVSEEDHLATLGNVSPSIGNVSTYIASNTHNGDNDNSTNTHNGDINNITTNVTLVLPERTTQEDFRVYLETLDHLGFRTPDQVATMPGKMLMFTRGAKQLPGALVERNRKIVEKLPDGSERVMAKKKAIQTYTHEAVDALCSQPPAVGVTDFLDTERGLKKTKMSIRDAAKLRISNPIAYHGRVPEDVKFRHQKLESHTEKCLDEITTENKNNGFL